MILNTINQHEWIRAGKSRGPVYGGWYHYGYFSTSVRDPYIEQQEGLLIKKLVELRNLILTNDCFSFLGESISIAHTMELVAYDYGRANIVGTAKSNANLFYTHHGIKYDLNEEQWDKLYSYSTVNSLKKEQVALDYDITRKTTSIARVMNSFIQEYLENTPNNSKYTNNIKPFFHNKNAAHYLSNLIKNYLLIYSRNFKDKNKPIYRANFARFLGLNIIISFINQVEILELLCEFLETGEIKKYILDNKKNKKVKEAEIFRLENAFYKDSNILVNAIFASDPKPFLNFVNKKYRAANKKCKENLPIIASLLKTYLKYLCLNSRAPYVTSKDNPNKILFIATLKELQAMTNQEEALEINKTLDSIALQMGDIVINYCIENELLQKDMKIERRLNQANKTTAILKVPPEIMLELSGEKMNKPYFHECNKNVNLISTVGLPLTFNAKVHNSINGFLTINKKSYLYRNLVPILLKVDLSYLIFILEQIALLHKSTDIEELNNIKSMIYSWYDINEKELELLQKYPRKEIAEFSQVVKIYMLNFKELEYISLEHTLRKLCENKEIMKNDVAAITSIKNIFNKAKNIKFYIQGLLKDCVVYARFKYIIHDGFLDSRGRYYYHGVLTNIQNFVLGKMLLKPFADLHRVYESIDLITKYLSETLEPVFAVQLQKARKLYIKTDDALHIEYLYRFMDTKKITFNDFKRYLFEEDFEDIKTVIWVKNNIKKLKETCILHSLMYQYQLIEQRMPYIGDHYDLDARCSGLQMIAILLKSKPLAKLVNLIPNKNNEIIDIYSLANQGFNSLIQLMTKFVTTLNQDLFKDNKSYKIYLKCDPIKKHNLFNSLLIELESVIPDNYINEELYKSLKILEEPFLIQKITIENKTLKTRYLLIAYVINNILKIIKENEWDTDGLLQDRTLFKHAVMTLNYNATAHGRIEEFFDQLCTNPKLRILHYNNIMLFARFMELYFSKVFVPKYLNEITLMKKLSEEILTMIMKDDRLIIHNKNFKMVYRPLSTKAIRVNTAFYSLGNSDAPEMSKRKQSIKYKIHVSTNKLDKREFSSGFMPNFIQSMDAHVAHYVKETYVYLNNRLKNENKDCFIYDFANHDTFGSILRPYARIIIKQAYFNAFKDNYLHSLQLYKINKLDSLISKEIKNNELLTVLDLLYLNDHFVK